MDRNKKRDEPTLSKKGLNRRDFLKMTGGTLVGSSLLLGGSLPGKVFAQKKTEEAISDIDILYIEQGGTEALRLMTDAWGKLGLKVNPTVQPAHIVVPRAYDREYEHVVYCFWSSAPERLDAAFWLSEFYHSRNAEKGKRNWGQYINPKADQLIDEQESELDTEKRRDLIWKIQAEVAKDHPIWYVIHDQIFTVYNSKNWKGVVNMLGCPPNRADAPWTLINMEPKGQSKIFRLGFTIDLTGQNPFTQANASSQGLIRLVYDRFVQIAPDLKPVPWAAESWNWVNKSTLDLKVRRGMKFHDGKPVTPEDAAFSFEYLLKHQMPRYGTVTSNLSAVKLLDDGSVRLSLKKPSASFVGSALTYAHIIPKHIWEKVEKPIDFEDPQLIGSGPFKITSWKKGERYFFESHKDHFSKPKMDGFYLILIPSLESQIGLLESGEIDMIENKLLTYSLCKDLTKKPNLSFVSTDNPAFFEMRPKCTTRPFNDVEFRRALHHAIPKEQIVKIAYEGQGVVGHNTPITPKNKYWHNPKIPFVDFNLEKSKAILKKAGYSWNERGRLCLPKKA